MSNFFYPHWRNSTCEGIVSDGLIHFKDILNGRDGCDVGKPEKQVKDGFLFDIWRFSVGYDDLWDVDPLGNEVVKVFCFNQKF